MNKAKPSSAILRHFLKMFTPRRGLLKAIQNKYLQIMNKLASSPRLSIMFLRHLFKTEKMINRDHKFKCVNKLGRGLIKGVYLTVGVSGEMAQAMFINIIYEII